MIATGNAVSVLLLERLCSDMKAQVQAQFPPPAPAIRPREVWQRVTSRASLLISIAGAACTSVIQMTMYR